MLYNYKYDSKAIIIDFIELIKLINYNSKKGVVIFLKAY